MRWASAAGNRLPSPHQHKHQHQHQHQHRHQHRHQHHERETARAMVSSHFVSAYLNNGDSKEEMPNPPWPRPLAGEGPSPQPSVARLKQARCVPCGRRRQASHPTAPATATSHGALQTIHRYPRQRHDEEDYLSNNKNKNNNKQSHKRKLNCSGVNGTSDSQSAPSMRGSTTRDDAGSSGIPANNISPVNSYADSGDSIAYHITRTAQGPSTATHHCKQPPRERAKKAHGATPAPRRRKHGAASQGPLVWAAILVLALNCIDLGWVSYRNTPSAECGPAAARGEAPPLFHPHEINAVGGSTLSLLRLTLPGAAAASPRRLPSAADIAPYTPTFTQARALQHHHDEGTRVMVMVNGDCNNAKHTARAIYRTWSTLPGHQFVAVRFIIGDSGTRQMECSGDAEVEHNMMVYLGRCSDAYPPVDKVLCMWEHARNAWLDNYDYFLKVDADTYLNLPNLLVLLAQNPPSRHLFAGGVGRGRDQKLPPYCMGPAYVLSHRTLATLPEGLSQNSPKLPNSDTTFSALVKQSANISCLDGVHPQFRWSFMNRYWDFKEGDFLGVVLNEQEQSVLPLNHALNSALLRAISAHPFKTEESMMTFHDAVFYNRLPLFPFPKATRDQPVPEQLRPLCVYNPMRQFEVSGFMLRECSPVRPQRPRKLQKGYVVYLHHHDASRERATAIASQLKQHNIEPVLFNGVDGSRLLTSKTNLSINPGELGLRESYRRLFLQLFSETGVDSGSGGSGAGQEQRAHLGMGGGALGDDLYLVVEDDVIFSPTFERQLNTLLQDPRCGSYLSSGSGGVLLLGATIWRNGSYPKVNRYTGGWTLADMDRNNHPGTLCYNFNSGVYGTFAFVLDRRAMRLLLTWLNNPRYASRPIDHAWNFLSDQGIPVRAAFPYLVIPRVDTSIIHKTGTHADAQRRAKIHRWYFADGEPSKLGAGGNAKAR